MYAVQMQGITKRFGPVVANDHIHFDLKQGEIHALLGENGAGKTTLMRILYGLYSADEGEVRVKEQLAHVSSPKDAIQLGIGMVTQHFALVPTLTVAENVVLGYTDGFRVNPKGAEQRVALAGTRFGVEVDPAALVRHLSVGERQRVEILKALYRNAQILILDEPTAVLVPQEVDVLFQTLERLRQGGLSVIFISHKLNEVTAIADRITVLRKGKITATGIKTSETNRNELARLMVGREVIFHLDKKEQHPGDIVLEVKDICAENDKGLQALNGVSFEVRSGEIVGLAGVAGNGQRELAQTISGLRQCTCGEVLLNGERINDKNTRYGIQKEKFKIRPQ